MIQPLQRTGAEPLTITIQILQSLYTGQFSRLLLSDDLVLSTPQSNGILRIPGLMRSHLEHVTLYYFIESVLAMGILGWYPGLTLVANTSVTAMSTITDAS